MCLKYTGEYLLIKQSEFSSTVQFQSYSNHAPDDKSLGMTAMYFFC